MKDNVYRKFKDYQAILDVRIELCKSSFFSFENAVIGVGTVSKVPNLKTPWTYTLSTVIDSSLSKGRAV